MYLNSQYSLEMWSLEDNPLYMEHSFLIPVKVKKIQYVIANCVCLEGEILLS